MFSLLILLLNLLRSCRAINQNIVEFSNKYTFAIATNKKLDYENLTEKSLTVSSEKLKVEKWDIKHVDKKTFVFKETKKTDLPNMEKIYLFSFIVSGKVPNLEIYTRKDKFDIEVYLFQNNLKIFISDLEFSFLDNRNPSLYKMSYSYYKDKKVALCIKASYKNSSLDVPFFLINLDDLYTKELENIDKTSLQKRNLNINFFLIGVFLLIFITLIFLISSKLKKG
ncbi:hypothetical protein NGRA_2728 [Nosema granulosis]|uniref:Uncharacterized protein n=1 Tax=Nosema granulosis TaxID=83296 RepID=A0A9P6KXV0_9MICR|nr:hypothetical protein NGRA_2728 [Nosema granulosis]